MSRYAKFIAALVGAAAEAGVVLADGDASRTDVILIAAAAVTAMSVYAVKNKPPGTP